MLKFFLTLIMILLLAFSSFSQEVKQVSFNELKTELRGKPDEIIVVNFWATWCKPCVEELPFFATLEQEWKDEPVKFIFVSLDFKSQTQDVADKVKELNLGGAKFQLLETGGEWIDQVDSKWSGAIPYTILFLPNGKKVEHYDAFNGLEDLKHFIVKNSNNLK